MRAPDAISSSRESSELRGFPLPPLAEANAPWDHSRMVRYFSELATAEPGSTSTAPPIRLRLLADGSIRWLDGIPSLEESQLPGTGDETGPRPVEVRLRGLGIDQPPVILGALPESEWIEFPPVVQGDFETWPATELVHWLHARMNEGTWQIELSPLSSTQKRPLAPPLDAPAGR